MIFLPVAVSLQREMRALTKSLSRKELLPRIDFARLVFHIARISVKEILRK